MQTTNENLSFLYCLEGQCECKLVEEAQKIAAVLGYNYGSGEWYQNSYRVFQKSYKTEKISKKKKDSFIKKKFKKLFE